MRFFLLLCMFIPGIVRAEDDWRTVLHNIQQSVVNAVSKSDNYICAQDLSRFYYYAVSAEMACHQPPTVPSTPMRVQDRLKLDVAVSQGGEIYSWHGEHKFSATAVNDVVREGPISSGSFNGYLRNIFGERGVTFSYKGESKAENIELIYFGYDVPLKSSHYEVQAGKGFELAPFHGSFAARADTFELYSLTVTADGGELSSKTNICAAETKLTYQHVKIANHESLVPASFDLVMGSRNGTFTESKGVYSECREYKGDSVVKFDDDPTTGGAVQSDELQTEPLVAGIVLPISLRGEIDEDTAYSGLSVEAVLQHDVKIKKGVKISRGAILRGTLTNFEIFHEPMHAVSLKLEFNSIKDGNKIYLCTAVHQAAAGLLPSYGSGGAGMRGRRIGSSAPMQSGTSGEATDGSLVFTSRHMHLDKSYSNEFITVSPSETDAR